MAHTLTIQTGHVRAADVTASARHLSDDSQSIHRLAKTVARAIVSGPVWVTGRCVDHAAARRSLVAAARGAAPGCTVRALVGPDGAAPAAGEGFDHVMTVRSAPPPADPPATRVLIIEEQAFAEPAVCCAARLWHELGWSSLTPVVVAVGRVPDAVRLEIEGAGPLVECCVAGLASAVASLRADKSSSRAVCAAPGEIGAWAQSQGIACLATQMPWAETAPVRRLLCDGDRRETVSVSREHGYVASTCDVRDNPGFLRLAMECQSAALPYVPIRVPMTDTSLPSHFLPKRQQALRQAPGARSRVGRGGPNAPKRPQTAFFLFAGERRCEVVAPAAEVAKQLGVMWKALGVSGQAVYRERAAQLREQYTAAWAAYAESDEFKGLQHDRPAVTPEAAKRTRDENEDDVPLDGTQLVFERGGWHRGVEGDWVCDWDSGDEGVALEAASDASRTKRMPRLGTAADFTEGSVATLKRSTKATLAGTLAEEQR